MTIQTVENRNEERQQRMTLLPLISGGVALVLVIAVGVGLWARSERGSETTTHGGPDAPVMTESISEGTAPLMGGKAELERERAAAADAGGGRTGRSDSRPTIYIARSEAQAGAQRSLIDATNANRAGHGLPPLDATVVVAGSPEEREQAARMFAELNAHGAGQGVAEIQFVEMLDEAATTPNSAIARTGATVAGAQELPFTVFVVESKEAAGRLAQELEMLIPVGGALPRDVGREQVVIVATEEDAAAARGIIEGLQLTHGHEGVQVVDWRPAPARGHVLPDARGNIPQPLSDHGSDMP